MKKILLSVVLTLAAGAGAARAQPAAGDQQPAPLVMAEGGEIHYLNFQIGADAFGGPSQGGVNFIAGVNATLLYRICDLLWVGIRPALHYGYREGTPYEATWLHADAAFHLNFLQEPVRLYVVGAGGYTAALDGDLYRGLAHGWSVFGGLGTAWRFDGPLGLFIELGFRGAGAKRDETVLDLGLNGEPQCTSRLTCLDYKTKIVTRDLGLTVFTINIGLVFQQ
jgi:hypothetical protein